MQLAAYYIPCPFPYFPMPYGCWCGFTIPFPSPWMPIDDMDHSCKIHDYCYEEASANFDCGFFDDYIYSYDWHDEDGEVLKKVYLCIVLRHFSIVIV